jgi:RNA polymerase sigma-70 factor, ECF subfamily
MAAGKEDGVPASKVQREIFARYYGRVRRFFRRRGFCDEDCQDLTQETLLRVFQHMDELRDEASAEAWILHIAANVWKNELRFRKASKRAGTNISVEASLEGAPDAFEATLLDKRPPVPGALDAAVAAEKHEAIHQCLGKLPPRMRICLLKYADKQLQYQEIADDLRLSIQSVKSHIHQARKRLRDCVERALAGGPR